MKFKALRSSRLVDIKVGNYLIDWDKKVSGPQKAVKDFLYPFWNADVVLEEFRVPGSLLRIDLVNLQKHIAIEVSPSHHRQYNRFFHRSRSGYLSLLKRDSDKEKWCIDSNFKYVEIFEEDIPELCRDWFREKYRIEL
jgi:hypothetical protein